MAASSQAFASSSSPVSPSMRRRRRSRFTYKHLSTLAQSSPHSPLRVCGHIDLDAFYAQCETVRLGIDPSQPLAVQQWQGLIAINYPARAFGLNRHVTITEAKQKCPHIICQHVATWREGDTRWSYSENAAQEIATRKVSLDPYREQSRKILALIKSCLPADLQRVEKAGIDEVFLDLSAQVHAEMLRRFPELRGPPPYDDPSTPLPWPTTSALDWAADALVDLDGEHSEEDDPDWDDVAMLIASEIVRDVRKEVLEKLHYTCSAGISCNKMLAKLASAHKKPNGQTVVRNRAVQQFLRGTKFTKIRNLGGKLGDELVAAFNTDAVMEMLGISMEQLKKQFGDDTGTWLYGILRGEDYSEVNPRTAIKSMLSAKSFRPSINSFEVGCKWLRIFVADIYGRLVEEGVLENKRRPRTMTLHHRQGGQMRSKSAPILSGRIINEDGLFELAKTLLGQVVVDGRAWPCANLSLSVGGFEDGVAGNRGIGSFLVRGDEARAMKTNNHSYQREGSSDAVDGARPNKQRRVGDAAGITKFFSNVSRTDGAGGLANELSWAAEHVADRDDDNDNESDSDSDAAAEADMDPDGLEDDGAGGDTAVDVGGDGDVEATNAMNEDVANDPLAPPTSAQRRTSPSTSTSSLSTPSSSSRWKSSVMRPTRSDAPAARLRPQTPPGRPRTTTSTSTSTAATPTAATSTSTSTSGISICPRCSKAIAPSDTQEHADFHFAQDLQHQHSSPVRERASSAAGARAKGRAHGMHSSTARSAAGRGGSMEKGQQRLAFGQAGQSNAC